MTYFTGHLLLCGFSGCICSISPVMFNARFLCYSWKLGKAFEQTFVTLVATSHGAMLVCAEQMGFLVKVAIDDIRLFGLM